MLPVGSGEFGDVFRAKWHGSFVAAKLLKRSDEIALGDFRTEVRHGRSLKRAMGCFLRGVCWCRRALAQAGHSNKKDSDRPQKCLP